MASDKLVKFAAGLNAGKSAHEAAKLAGYSPSYARRNGTNLTRQAREAGLLVSEDAVRRAAELVEEELTNEDDLREMLGALKASAKKGDIGALRTWFERMFGGVPQSVRVDATHEARLAFDWDAAVGAPARRPSGDPGEPGDGEGA